MKRVLPIIILFLLLQNLSLLGVNKHQSLTVNEGMSINEMTCVFQDRGLQYMWFGTQHGLNRYDGHQVTTIYAERDVKGAKNFVNAITEDNVGRLWVASKQGIGGYDYYNNAWLSLPHEFNMGNYQSVTFQDSLIYAIRDNRDLVKFSSSSPTMMEVKSFSDLGRLMAIVSVGSQCFAVSGKGLLRLAKNGDLELVNCPLIPYSNSLKYIAKDNAIWVQSGSGWVRVPLENGELQIEKAQTAKAYLGIEFDIEQINYSDGNYYVAVTLTDMQGILKIDKHHCITTLLDNNSVNDIHIDNNENVWCTTWQSGVVKCPSKPSPFMSFTKSEDKEGLQSRLIRGFCELDDETILLASETHGVIEYNRKSHQFSKPYTAEYSHKSSEYYLFGNILHSLKRDWKGRLWAGFHRDGFNVISGDDREKINAQIEQIFKGRPLIIVDDILVDNKNKKVYIFSRYRVFVYSEATGKLKVSNIKTDYFTSVSRDAEGQIWIGQRGGLAIYSADFAYKKTFLNEELYKSGLLDEDIATMHLSANHQMWIGTYGNGLFRYDPAKRAIEKISPPVHRSFNIVFSIIDDDNGNIWLGTNNGLYCYYPSIQSFDRYTVSDGIQDNQFNYSAAYKTTDGELFFGGINGFTHFHPNSIHRDKQLIAPRFSSFKIGEKAMSLYTEGQLKERLKIPYDENSFEFTFFTPDYTSSHDYLYAYQLLGHSNREYFSTASQAIAQFDNLPPGKYRLKVKVTRSNSEWSQERYSPWIIVQQPWYKTLLAYLIYLLIATLIVFFVLNYLRQKSRYRSSLYLAQLEKEKSEEITAAKLRFFTDIAHEIRTPLTLIVGPLNDMLASRRFDKSVSQSLTLMQKSAIRLMSLMDELLLFRKAEAGRLPLALSKHYLSDFVSDVCELYKNELESHKINFSCVETDSEVAVFDKSKLEKVLSNLIGNALKYTPDGGEIKVETKALEQGFSFSVKDNGAGMDANAVQQVFTRFYQNEKSKSKGFGIGLALAKRIVEAHSGQISVESEVGKGTSFEVIIPALEVNVENVDTVLSAATKPIDNSIPTSAIKTDKKGSILLVEDDPEIRQYIADIFSAEYDVVQKENGFLGWQYAKGQLPDLIISDNQMPEMSGVEMCANLKSDITTSHIPLVLLSAFNEIDDQIKGLNEGADDYIGKPFDKGVLYQKITNLLNSRALLSERFNSGEKLEVKQLPNSERLLIDKINAFILQEMKNENLDVPALCEHLKIGKTTLTEKLKNLLNTTPAEYIKKTKLQEAYRLLTVEGLNVSEAAYATGFSPGYFSTCFKKEFGVSPGKV